MNAILAPVPAIALPSPAGALSGQHLTFQLRGGIYAMPLEHVREIIEFGSLTTVPRMPAFVRGVMNLRGAVVPVLDLAARIGLGAATLGRRSCIVIVESAAADEAESADPGSADELETLVVGLLVDAVYEVFEAPADAVEPVPALGTAVPAHFLAGMTRARGDVVGVLALGRVLARSELTESIGSGQRN